MKQLKEKQSLIGRRISKPSEYIEAAPDNLPELISAAAVMGRELSVANPQFWENRSEALNDKLFQIQKFADWHRGVELILRAVFLYSSSLPYLRTCNNYEVSTKAIGIVIPALHFLVEGLICLPPKDCLTILNSHELIGIAQSDWKSIFSGAAVMARIISACHSIGVAVALPSIMQDAKQKIDLFCSIPHDHRRICLQLKAKSAFGFYFLHLERKLQDLSFSDYKYREIKKFWEGVNRFNNRNSLNWPAVYVEYGVYEYPLHIVESYPELENRIIDMVEYFRVS